MPESKDIEKQGVGQKELGGKPSEPEIERQAGQRGAGGTEEGREAGIPGPGGAEKKGAFEKPGVTEKGGSVGKERSTQYERGYEKK